MKGSHTGTLKKLQSAILKPVKSLQTSWDEWSDQILSKVEKVMLLLKIQ